MSYKEVFKSNESSQHQLFIGTSRKSFVCVCVCVVIYVTAEGLQFKYQIF